MTMNSKRPSQPEIKKRSLWFEMYLIFFLSAFTALAFFAKQYPYFPFDIVITRQIQLITLPWFNYLMLLMTDIGYVIPGTLLVGAASLLLILFKKVADAALLIFSAAGAVLTSLIFKVLISRPRPDPDLIYQAAQYQVQDSFPSGHVLFFMGFAGFLLYLSWIYLPKNLMRSLVVTFWGILLVLMGLSRIYLGAHWFSDTLGAYLIGGVWLLGIIYLRKKVISFKKP